METPWPCNNGIDLGGVPGFHCTEMMPVRGSVPPVASGSCGGTTCMLSESTELLHVYGMAAMSRMKVSYGR
jgi:hypothetical protein